MAQGTQTLDSWAAGTFARWALPGGQETQESSESAPSAVEYVPSGQALQTVALLAFVVLLHHPAGQPSQSL